MLNLFPEFVEEPEYKPVHLAIERWLKTYDLIFKIPIEFQVMDDGVREGDADFQKKIDRKIDDLYDSFSIAPVIISGTVEERTRAVLSHTLPLISGNKAI